MFIQGTLARDFGSVCRYTADSDQTVCYELRRTIFRDILGLYVSENSRNS